MYVVLAAFLPVFACKKSKGPAVEFKYEYIPQNVGTYCIYDVTEIRHDDASAVHDTNRYELKEKIESTYIDDQGRPSLRIERSKKNGAGSWYVSDIWNATVTTSMYEKSEEDEKFIKLSFPVREDRKWNGNAYNQQPQWEYTYQDADVSRQINGTTFPLTTCVLQRDEFNFVQRQLCSEVYAYNIGLISKHYKDITITGFDTTLAIKGKELYMTIKSYGVE